MDRVSKQAKKNYYTKVLHVMQYRSSEVVSEYLRCAAGLTPAEVTQLS